MGTLNAADPSTHAPCAEVSVRPDSPPVVILNLFYSGLGIARQLSGRGIRVVGLSANRTIYGNFTRLCEVRYAPDSQDYPEDLLDFLMRAGTDFSGAVIFPTRDADVIFLDRFRSELDKKYLLAIPPAPCLRRSIDKYQLALAASEADVCVPRTIKIDSAKELFRVPDEVEFPCVLKPVSAWQWRVGNAWQRVGGRKAVRVDCQESLVHEYDQISQVTPNVLVQEWIPGAVDQIAVLGAYVDEQSELLSYFTARKLLQSPDDCGTGCIVRSEPIAEIVEPTRRLCRALQYRGMAEIEYKYDRKTGRYKLIEINTRHWDQHQLGEASGINLSWVAYCHLSGRSIPISKAHTVYATWVAEDVLLMRLLKSLFRRELRPANLRHKLGGPRVYGIFAANDPIPFCRYFVGVLCPRLMGMLVLKFLKTLLRS